jgi:hypothetical protein
MGRRYGSFTHAVRITIQYRANIVLRTRPRGSHRHGLLFKIETRSPGRPTFEVIATARLACDGYLIEVPPTDASRPMCSCTYERQTWRLLRKRVEGEFRFSGF